jgi:ankyrin repeat protein
MLAEHGALIDKSTTNGITPLVVAAQKGYLEIVKVLVEHGASIDKSTSFFCVLLLCVFSVFILIKTYR